MPSDRSWLKIACTAVVLAAAGCSTTRDAAVPMVRVRAEKDLACAGDKIEITSKLGGRYEARGCGRTATYASACEDLRCSVSKEGEEAPAWRDRPDPGSPFDPR
jgi:hypothetical protein